MAIFLGKILPIVSLALSVSVMGQTPPAATGGQEPWPPAGVSRPGEPGLVLPFLVSQVEPSYTREAMREKLQGAVVLSAIVLADGTVGEIRVVKGLGLGLDESAIASAKQWRFRPGTKNGTPVPVFLTFNVTFRLHDGPPPAPPAPPVPAPFTWPEGFSPELDTSVPGPGWTDDVEETATVKLRISFPSRWILKKGSGVNGWVTLMSPAGSSVLVIAVARPAPVPFSLAPMPQALLDQMGPGLSKMPGFIGSEIRKVGQAKSGEQFWLWLDLVRPFDPAATTPETQQLLTLARPNARGLAFMTSAGQQNVMVICTTIVPRDLSAEDADAQLRKAGAEFIAVVARMTVQVK